MSGAGGRSSVEWRVVIVVLVVLFVASLMLLGHVYAPLTVAFVLAYLLDPVVTKLKKLGLSRDIAVPLTLVVFFVLLTAAGMAIIPKIIAQGQELVSRLPAVYQGVTGALAPVSLKYLGYNVFQDIDKFVADVGTPSTLVSPVGNLLKGVFTHTFRFITALLGLLIIPLMSYYLLRDFPTIFSEVLYLIPKRHHRTAAEIRAQLHTVLGGFIRGQLVVSTILAVYYGLAFAALRVELAVVLGLLAGFLNIVPYVGIASVIVLTFLIAFVHAATTGTYVGLAIIFAVGMGMEGSFLTPRIVGRKVGLSPLTLIIALLVGGELMGLKGMLIAVPLAAIGRVFLSVFLDHYRDSEGFKRA